VNDCDIHITVVDNNHHDNIVDDVHIAIGDNNYHDDDEIYSNIDDVFKGLNPGFNLTHNLSYFDK
jgi:hypothetical protein